MEMTSSVRNVCSLEVRCLQRLVNSGDLVMDDLEIVELAERNGFR